MVELSADGFRREYDDLRRDVGRDRVPAGRIFALAKRFIAAEVAQIEDLLEDPRHDVRVGAVSIMDFEARGRRTSPERRRDLYQLYLRRHDRIDNWDLVDRAAPHVVGGYLYDKPREPLYRLAASPSQWERRTSIVSTWYFIRLGDVDDTFRLGAVLAHDPADLVQKAVGGWIREAGKRDPAQLICYLDQFAATMPRTALRYAIEKLDPPTRQHYLKLKSTAGHGEQSS
ncbi:DNA alkylation repair protein [Kribbella deserti]